MSSHTFTTPIFSQPIVNVSVCVTIQFLLKLEYSYLESLKESFGTEIMKNLAKIQYWAKKTFL